ncbi:hypothetical protein SAMN05216489_08484 [Streptomyces sp. 3213]|nr:hypothetical protein SAMN05216489_08484 [Streptomyces sp. 3213] [Streptomyces sp. 3213.3]
MVAATSRSECSPRCIRRPPRRRGRTPWPSPSCSELSSRPGVRVCVASPDRTCPLAIDPRYPIRDNRVTLRRNQRRTSVTAFAAPGPHGVEAKGSRPATRCETAGETRGRNLKHAPRGGPAQTRRHDSHATWEPRRNSRSDALYCGLKNSDALHMMRHRKQIERHHLRPVQGASSRCLPASAFHGTTLPSAIVRGKGQDQSPRQRRSTSRRALRTTTSSCADRSARWQKPKPARQNWPQQTSTQERSAAGPQPSPPQSRSCPGPSAPLAVWTAHDDASDGSRLLDVLRRSLGTFAPLAAHHDVTNRRMYGAAVHSTRRAENAGTGTSAFLLTGSPFATTPGSSWRSPLLEGHTRTAWDVRHIVPTRGFRRYRSNGISAPPHVGALWTTSLQTWRGPYASASSGSVTLRARVSRLARSSSLRAGRSPTSEAP